MQHLGWLPTSCTYAGSTVYEIVSFQIPESSDEARLRKARVTEAGRPSLSPASPSAGSLAGGVDRVVHPRAVAAPGRESSRLRVAIAQLSAIRLLEHV